MKSALTCALLLALACAANGQITIGSEPLEQRMSKVDVVCIAEISKTVFSPVVERGQNERLGYLVKILVVYKGRVESPSRVLQSMEQRFDLADNLRYILFLNHMPASEDSALEDALAIPQDFPSGHDLKSPHPLEGDIDEALLTLSTGKSQLLLLLGQFSNLTVESQRVLNRLRDSDDASLALMSYYILLSKGIQAGQLFPLFLERLINTPSEHWPEVNVAAFFPADATISDEEPLEKLAKSSRRDISFAALAALRKISDPKTTAFFIKELDSQDSDVQYIAVITLAEMHHKYGEFAPGMGPFENDRGRYVRLWKDWFEKQERPHP